MVDMRPYLCDIKVNMKYIKHEWSHLSRYSFLVYDEVNDINFTHKLPDLLTKKGI